MNYPGTCSHRDRGPPQGNDGPQPGPSHRRWGRPCPTTPGIELSTSHRRRGRPCPGTPGIELSACGCISRDQAGERFSDHFQHLASLRSFQTR